MTKMGRPVSTLRSSTCSSDGASSGRMCPSFCSMQTCFGVKNTDSYKPNNSTGEAATANASTSNNSSKRSIKLKQPSTRLSNGSVAFDKLPQQQQPQFVRTRSSKKRKTAQSSLTSCCCRTPPISHDAAEPNKTHHQADSPPSNFLLDNDVTTTAVACSREVDDSSSSGSDTNSQSKLVDQLPSTPDDECSEEKIFPPSTPTSSTTRGSFTSSPHLQQQLLDNVGMKTCSEEEANIELPNVIDARCGDAENFSQSCKQDQCVSKVEKDVESGESNNSSPLICRFRNLVKDETQVLQDLISKWNSELETAEQNSCPNEVCDDIRAVIGKTGLIISQRFTQFLSLVNQADGKTVSPSAKTASRKVYESDLDGFWEMDYIQVKKVKDSFSQLEERKNNDWKILSTPIKSTENNQVKKKRKATKKTPSPSLSPEAIEKRKIAQMERKKIMQAMKEKRKQEMKESSQQDFVSIINIKEPVSAVIEHPPIITTDPILENKKEITNVVITAENEHHLFHHITPLKGDNDKINTTLQHTALVG